MRFLVQAVDSRQSVVTLNIDAASEAAAIEAARREGLAVLSVKARGTDALRLLRGRRARFPTTLFSLELISLLEAGLNLVEALQTLGERESPGGGERHTVMSGILGALSRGESFSQAAGRFPQHFSPLYIATLKASERSGNLKEALSRYVTYQEELERVRKKIVSASIYPVILLGVGTLVIGFLILYVLPRFAQVYEDISGTLPFFSALLLAFGRAIREYGWIMGPLALAAAGAAAWAATQASVRVRVIGWLWKLPGLGERMKVYQLARLYRTVGMLLRAGIPAVKALEMSGELLSTHLRVQLAKARRQVEEGIPMSAALDAAGLATPVAARMMAVGEKSGEMGEMMAKIARFHDDEMARFIDWFTRAFEPLLMAVLGLAVGLVVVLMYMPIFELAGSLE